MESEEKKQILKVCMGKGFLLDKEVLDILSGLDSEDVNEIIEKFSDLKIDERMITKKLFFNNFEQIKKVFSEDKKMVVEKFFVSLGYSRTEIEKENIVLESENNFEKKETINGLKLLAAPAFTQRKVSVQDFVKHFRSRYEMMKGFLEARGLEDLISIRRIGDERGNYTIIVAVLDKRITKNKNLFLTVEDMTGTSVVLVNANKKEVFEKAKDLLVDDIVAFSVSGTKEMLFANDVIFPEAGLSEKRNSDEDVWVAFISDIHAGSSMFMENNFLKFIKWVNGQEGDERHKEISRKLKYIFINGDGVDGVGHFPGQDKVLNIQDIKGQYKKLAELLKLVRGDINMVFASGNHDAVWVGEPQPIVGEGWAPEMYNIKNLTLVPNPCVVEIDGGFKILMYHGFGAHGFVNEIEDIRLNYGHDSPTRIVKEMLKRRHLSPMHGYSDYIPCDKDSLVIDIVPDIITTADLHKSDISIYNNILLIATSCWQSMTPFQEKMGNKPDFCKVPLFNLKTREIKILDFEEGTKEIKWDCGDDVSCDLESHKNENLVEVKNVEENEEVNYG